MKTVGNQGKQKSLMFLFGTEELAMKQVSTPQAGGQAAGETGVAPRRSTEAEFMNA
jgi:hypothetical protein